MRMVMRIAAWAMLLGSLTVFPLHAQNYPTHPVRVIVPFPAGGVTDVTARLASQKLGERLGQQFIIENRPGASGTLGMDAVAKAAPDGYTILISTGDFMETPSLMPKMGFDPAKDLVPVSMISAAPLMLGAHWPGGIASLPELIARAKAAPGGIAFSSPGTGTINHLAVEWLSIEAGMKLLHVPYRGGAPGAAAVAAGDVPIGALTISASQSLIDAGRIKPLALMTRQRASFVPAGVPTLAELGFAVDAALWVGLFVPASTPPTIVSRLESELSRILRDTNVIKQLNDLGTEASSLDRQAFAERIRIDAARYAKVIEQTGIRAEP